MTTLLERSLITARATTEAAANSYLQNKAAASLDVGGMVVGSGGSLNSLISSSGDKSAQNYQLIRDWIATCLSAICRRTSAQNYGAGTKIASTEAGKFAFFANKAHAGGRRLPASVKETIVGSLAIEPFEDHPSLEFLAQPNPLQGKHEFIAMWIMNLYASGNAYVVGGDMGGEFGKQAWVLPSPWIVPKHDGGLFTSYILKPDGYTGEGIPLPKEVVHRSYFPDPANLKKALCPIITQLRAIRIDESIQSSQEQMFDKGIFPNVILEVGDTVGPDGKSMGKPVLTGAQRRQLVRAVREIWNATLSNGDPAIIDGLIKDIKKLNAMPAEMDWLQSGESVKKRIFQMFGVNPYIVGDQLAGSRAQSAVAEQNYLDNVINPLTDRITVMLNKFIAPWFMNAEPAKLAKPTSKKLILWIEEAVPKDDELLLRKTTAARLDGSISRNESRSAHGLPPSESPAADVTGLASTAQGAAAITQLLVQVGSGTIGPESAKNTLVTIYGLTEEQADGVLGDTEYVEPPPPTIIQQPPKPEGNGKPGNAPPTPDEGDQTIGPNPAAHFGGGKFNDSHDEHGRFAEGGGGSSGGAEYHSSDHGTSTVKTSPNGQIKLTKPKDHAQASDQLKAMSAILDKATAAYERIKDLPNSDQSKFGPTMRLAHASQQMQRAMGYARNILGKDAASDLQNLLDEMCERWDLEPVDPDGGDPLLEIDSKSFATTKISRGEVKASHRRQVVRLEKEVASVLRPFFGSNTIQRLKELLPEAKSHSTPGRGTES